ncbi:hypothetical protein V8J88_25350 [Massilia sp. W12]|uniref:hypothetical protein n=1 Tax=Massilia sp. W12 TaxID=3126507 RepID=UPI0030CEC339
MRASSGATHVTRYLTLFQQSYPQAPHRIYAFVAKKPARTNAEIVVFCCTFPGHSVLFTAEFRKIPANALTEQGLMLSNPRFCVRHVDAR